MASERVEAGHERAPIVGTWIVLATLSLGYANLRLTMNREFEGARWQDLLDLQAPRPYVGRLLIPRALHLWQTCAAVDLRSMFLTVETLATFALMLGVARCLRTFVAERRALVAAVVLLSGLTTPFLLQHRWPIYYPYDAASMAFTAWGLCAALERRVAALTAITLLAAFNRETAVLLPSLGVAIWLHDERPTFALAKALPSFIAFAAARALVWTWTRGLPGPVASFSVNGRPRFINNAEWLNSGMNPLQLLSYTMALPIAYLLFRRRIPPRLRLIRIPLAIMFAGLMCSGNVYEPRIFGEILVALYIPVTVGVLAWTRGPPQASDDEASERGSFLQLVGNVPWGCLALAAWWALGTACLHEPSFALLFR